MSSIDFDLRQLEIFSKVVELQSFSKAAEVVFLAQASVSERIANLEKSIGTKLLDRMGRQVVPTKAGELLYRHAILLLDMKKNARLEMENFLGLRYGDIRVGGSTIPGEYILPEILGKFYKEYPFVSVILTVADSKVIEDLVHSGKLELGLIGSKSSSNDLISYNIWEDELVLVVNRQHKWATKKKIELEELFEEPFIIREPGSGTLKIMDEYLKKTTKTGVESLKTVARLGTSTAVKEGIKANLGISILSSRAIETEKAAGVLKIVKIHGMPPMTRPFYLIKDKRRIASPICQVMLDFLQNS
jgi:DNA-binding transcriptional LysR family regulator